MSERAAASAGFVVAGFGFAAAFLPWPGVTGPAAAIVAGFAIAGFGLRRHGALDRSIGAPVAGLAGVGLVAIALYATIEPALRGAGDPRAGAGIAAVAGVTVATLGYADWRAVGRDQLETKLAAAATGAAVGISGLLAIMIWAGIVGSAVRAVGPGALDGPVGTAASTIALGLGTGSVAAIYLRWSGRGAAFIDVAVPDRREIGIVAVGVLAIVGANLTIAAVFRTLGLESASHSVVRAAESNPDILLVLIPLAYLIIGPGEELLYRNVIQKSLYAAFSRPGAVAIASAIFAGAHVFAFAGESPLALLNTLFVVFALSLVLGAAYDLTGNVVVPALIHATFDAVAFALTYLELTGGLLR